jgi:hypothetical protein
MAVDPGNERSAYVVLEEDNTIRWHGILPNTEMLELVRDWRDDVAIEMIASYGMPVGREVFDTVLWIGRYVEASASPADVQLVYRTAVKLHLCGSSRAKDGNVRQAVIDIFGAKGTKKQPGPTYGFSKDEWQALAVAATVRGLQ